MAFNQSCYGLRAKKDIVTEDFLYYLIKHSVRVLKRNTHGSVFDTITRDTFENIDVDIPAISDQIKIASILCTIDDKIELNTKINNNLEQQAQAIYQQIFIDNASSDWTEGVLGDIADITSGKRPLMRSDNMTDEAKIPLIGAASVMGYTNKSNHTDKILVTGRVGTHGVIQRFSIPCWTSDNTLVITSPYYEYVYQILHGIDYKSMNRGSTQPLITQGDLKKVSILIPDTKTLLRFESLVGTLMCQYESNIFENKKLVETRDALLPKLMSGEIDLTNI